MTQIQIRSQHGQYVTKLEWRQFASAGFRILGGIKEAAAKRRFDGEGRLLVDRDSTYARTFAGLMVAEVERAADSVSCSICVLSTDIIDFLPGGTLTPKKLSVVLGFVDIEGKISPVVFSHEQVLFQTANGGIHASVYDEHTDIAGMLRIMCAPPPVELASAGEALGIKVNFGLRFE